MLNVNLAMLSGLWCLVYAIFLFSNDASMDCSLMKINDFIHHIESD